MLAVGRDWATLSSLVRAHHPEIAVVRLPLAGLDEPDQLLALRSTRPGLGLVVLMPHYESVEPFRRIACSGRITLMTTDTQAWTVRDAIRLTAEGWTTLSPDLSEKGLADIPLAPPPARPFAPGLLSMREQRVLEGLARGQHESELGHALGVSVRTVQALIAQCREKLGAADRTHAVAIALEAGLITGGLYDHSTTR